METLIDNRIFPKEMRDNKKTIKPKKTGKGSNLMITLLLLIILALVYYILVYKNKNTEQPQTYEEQQTAVVEKLQANSPEMTDQQRIHRVNEFFSN